jgi:signal transduction histidine kinase
VLRIARIESGRHAADFRPVDLALLLSDAAELYEPEAESRTIHLGLEAGAGLEVSGDPDLLFQAISNLVDNAIKFTPSGGAVRVSGRLDRQSVLVQISDSGPGIPEEFKSQVRERFFRAPSTDDVPGFGLGLSLVDAVARLHSSSLDFGNADPGTIVTWTLPLHSSRPDTEMT